MGHGGAQKARCAIQVLPPLCVCVWEVGWGLPRSPDMCFPIVVDCSKQRVSIDLMIAVCGNHGAQNEVLFEQRTPSTLRGYLNMSLCGGAGGAVGPFPRSVLWRLRIGEGSTMLCSKLCGVLTVQSADDFVEEKISITLAVRTSSSSLPAVGLHAQSADEHPVASPHGLPPLAAVASPMHQIPAWVRKTSRLKVQWIELSQTSTPKQTQLSLVKGHEGVTLDVSTGQRALQSANRDRSLLEAMFRIAGHKVQSLDVGCTFSDSPLSARGTSRYSSMRSVNGSTDQLSINGNQERGGQNSGQTSPEKQASPNRSARMGAQDRRAPSFAPQDTVPALNASVASSQPPIYHKPFWLGFFVGCAFGVTGVLTMLGQSGQLRESVEKQKVAVSRFGQLALQGVVKGSAHLKTMMSTLSSNAKQLLP